ncbi:hypothetical protein TSUD_385480 [Trifolium subterraneum]|uniref:GDSL esterase/lipase n=1 Tax=Trifolium subterraneum TaxID=3900 RepID=A0A2Z6NS04_TRISU|nr:hypothetical protein TSUD_385480 [Trifolium subterraneum]
MTNSIHNKFLTAASASYHYQHRWTTITLLLLIIASPPLLTAACSTYSSIFSFGDSLADTGNLYFSSPQPSDKCFFPPYGQTYFHHPSERCSDGRLIIDFIAEWLGIPMLKPYLGIKNGEMEDLSVNEGVNFAVIGATALEDSFFEEKGPSSCSLQFFQNRLMTKFIEKGGIYVSNFDL